MATQKASLSGRVMTMLGISAASADVEQNVDPIETPADAPAGEPAGDPPADEQPQGEAGKKKPKPGEEGYKPGEGEDDEDMGADAEQAEIAREAAAIATKAANARWQTVLASEEAKGRIPLATHLLATTDMAPDAIRASLALTPAQAAGTSFQQQMASIPNPSVTAGAVVEDDKPDHQSAWERQIAKTRGSIRK